MTDKLTKKFFEKLAEILLLKYCQQHQHFIIVFYLFCFYSIYIFRMFCKQILTSEKNKIKNIAEWIYLIIRTLHQLLNKCISLSFIIHFSPFALRMCPRILNASPNQRGILFLRCHQSTGLGGRPRIMDLKSESKIDTRGRVASLSKISHRWFINGRWCNVRHEFEHMNEQGEGEVRKETQRKKKKTIHNKRNIYLFTIIPSSFFRPPPFPFPSLSNPWQASRHRSKTRSRRFCSLGVAKSFAKFGRKTPGPGEESRDLFPANV